MFQLIDQILVLNARAHVIFGYLFLGLLLVLLSWSIIQTVRNVEDETLFRSISTLIVWFANVIVVMGIIMTVTFVRRGPFLMWQGTTPWHYGLAIIGVIGLNTSGRLSDWGRVLCYMASSIFILLAVILSMSLS